MLNDPKLKFYVEVDAIILEVEDEGTAIKVDVTEKVLECANQLPTETK